MAEVDVLIITHNEAVNLPNCLASLQKWVNQVFIVDSGSTDNTAEIASSFKANFIHHAWAGYAAQRNWGLNNLDFESDWILILDADEAVPTSLRDLIQKVIAKPTNEQSNNGYFLNKLTYFCGQPIRHCGYFPSWHLRLFKRGLAKYEDRLVHEHLSVPDPVDYLNIPLIHNDRRGLEHSYAKHNRYSTLEAEQQFLEIIGRIKPGIANVSPDTRRRRWLKSHLTLNMPFIAAWRFLYMYVYRLGFLDGWIGYDFCKFIAHYDGMVAFKLRHMLRAHRRSEPIDSIVSSIESNLSGLASPEGQAYISDAASESTPYAHGRSDGTGTLSYPKIQPSHATKSVPKTSNAIQELLEPDQRRLITLPVNPGGISGYHKAVSSDLQRLNISQQDTVVIYWGKNESGIENAKLIPRFPRMSWHRITRTLRLRTSVEVTARQLRSCLGSIDHYDSIFCGDITFYRALREIFPNQRLYVRLHNFFSLAASRKLFLHRHADWMYRLNLRMFGRLERELTRDPNTFVIFISEEERAFFHLHVRDRETDTWLIQPPTIRNAQVPAIPKLVWFGSIAAHTKFSVRYFTDRVFTVLRNRYPTLEFHLWGAGTSEFHAPHEGIYGHGFFDGDGLPLHGQAMYVVPDLLGGGVKVKVGDLIEQGAPFIATPFGTEGSVIPDSPNIMVADIDRWVRLLEEYMRRNNLVI